MRNDFNLLFLSRKLTSIRTATMYNVGETALQIPNDIIRLVQIDEDGQLWFTGNKPRNWIQSNDICFPTRLFFYQKGLEYYIEAKGKAIICNDEERINFQEPVQNDQFLFRMVPAMIEYTDTHTGSLADGWNKIMNSARHLLHRIFPVYQLSK